MATASLGRCSSEMTSRSGDADEVRQLQTSALLGSFRKDLTQRVGAG